MRDDAQIAATEAARAQLLQLLQAGLAAVDGRAVTRKALATRTLPPRIQVFAIGKAAAAMAQGAADALGAQVQRALVITRAGHAADLRARANDALLAKLTLIESSHPVPDARSLAAGAALVAAVSALGAGDFPLFLISGGSSSLVEVLREGVSLAALQQCNEAGLAEGLDIAGLNLRRRELSRIKGGGIAALLAGRAALALFISDVPDDSPAVIGSGLLGRAPNGLDNIERDVIASVDSARHAVVSAATAMGWNARECLPRFAGEARVVARDCLRELESSTATLLVWGGESTVHLPESPGRGGRNQHLALAAALAIADHTDLLLMAAGTDGNDGNTEDAGALVDGGSCARMQVQGIDPVAALQRADSGSALAASCDLIHTGPTGTNVGDLIIGARVPTSARRHADGVSDML